MRNVFVVAFMGALVVGCGGDSSNPTDGGTDGTIGNDGAGMDGASNTDGAMDAGGNESGGGDAAMDGNGGGDSSSDGGCVATWTSCSVCLTNNCAMTLTACNANNGCKSGFTALAACESMCGMNCIGTFENTGQEAQDLSDCGQNNCAVCGW